MYNFMFSTTFLDDCMIHRAKPEVSPIKCPVRESAVRTAHLIGETRAYMYTQMCRSNGRFYCKRICR